MKKLFIIPRPYKMNVDEDLLEYHGAEFQPDNQAILKFTAEMEVGNTKVVFARNAMLGSECYTLSVKKTGIYIGYSTLEGAYRACSTLKQIVAQVEDEKIPCLEIQDCPAINRRGYLLDLSRGKIPTMDVLKRFIDMLSDLKYNEFHLYVNRFGFQFKNFERYWKDRNALSAGEIKELDAYCRERFVKLVPNLNSFGHMEAFTEQEEFKHLAITDAKGKPSHTLNPLLDESLELVDSIFDGFFDNFSSDVVHIGMDETFYVGQNETKEVCEKYGVGRVYTEFLNKVLKLVVDKYHKTPMFWADIVFLHPEELVNIPDFSVVMDWGYESEYNYERHCRQLEEKGLRFYVCPGTSMWGSFTGRSNNAVFNMLSAAVSAREYHAEGYLLTEWGDGGYPQFYSTTYFPIVFGGSVAWNPERNVAVVRSEIVDSCKKYLDKYVYKIQGDVSLADIVYRMGNYYLEEKELYDNMTLCYQYVYSPKMMTPEDVMPFTRVIEYMEKLLEELKTVEADTNVLKDIEVNCKMVILFCKMHCRYQVTEAEVKELKETFVKLWNRENKPYIADKDVFVKKIDKLYTYYKENRVDN